MCHRQPTKWACGHSTTDVTQCNPPTRSCFAFFFRRRCPRITTAQLLHHEDPCPECFARDKATNRRSAVLEENRAAMVAAYRAHKAGSRESWGRAAPVQVPRPALDPLAVNGGLWRGPTPPLSSSRDRPRVSREAYRETDSADVEKQAGPGREEPSSEKAVGRRPVASRGRGPSQGYVSDGYVSGPASQRNFPGRAPEQWSCIPLN